MSYEDNTASATQASPSLEMLRTYPQLAKLCKDFGLKISPQPFGDWGDNIGYQLLSPETDTKLSPIFQSMPELETYADKNMVDILHKHLFEAPRATLSSDLPGPCDTIN